MNNIDLIESIDYLFNCDYFSDNFDPEGHEEHQDFAKTLLENYSWEQIYDGVFAFVTNNCTTPEATYNAINLYYCYLFDKKIIPNPYEFCGYILYRIDLDKYWDEYGDFVDSFVISILETCGVVNLKQNPYYQPWEDEKILKAIEEWKVGEN